MSEKLKTLMSSDYHRVQYFLLKLCTRFLLTNVFKRFCLDLMLFAKIKKDLVSTHSFFIFLLITQDLNKIKKVRIFAKFPQKILNFVVVGARQIFQVFRQIAWFLGNNRAFSKFRYRILYNLICITKL